MHKNRVLGTIIFLFVLAGLLILSLWWQDHYLWLSFSIVSISLLFLLYCFESRKVEARELVLLAVLAAIAAVGRIPFASIPSVQPTTFVIMMSGAVFGAESGFMIGTVDALASNMILGQGPWTPWQMAAWGLVGFTAGLLRQTMFMNRLWGRLVFGIIWGFLFGWIMNLWGFFSITTSIHTFHLNAFLDYFAASALFDSMHSLSNVFFIFVFSRSWMKNLTRFKRKYGLLEEP